PRGSCGSTTARTPASLPNLAAGGSSSATGFPRGRSARSPLILDLGQKRGELSLSVIGVHDDHVVCWIQPLSSHRAGRTATATSSRHRLDRDLRRQPRPLSPISAPGFANSLL